MEIEITWEYLYVNSDFLGLYLNLPIYLLVTTIGLWYAVRLLKRDQHHITNPACRLDKGAALRPQLLWAPVDNLRTNVEKP